MTDKAEVAFVTTLAESLSANEINIVQVAVVDDVAAAEHGAEAFEQAIFLKNMVIETLHCLEMVAVFGVIGMPHIPPVFAGAVFEPQRNNLPQFPLSHHSLFSVISVSIRYSTPACTSDSNPLLKK